MQVNSQAARFNSLATVFFPDHDGSEEGINIHLNFHGKKVRIVGFSQCGKVKIQIVDAIGRFEKEQAEVSVFDLIFETNGQTHL